MKVFISGPMRNIPDGNRSSFEKCEAALKGRGVSCYNPRWNEYGCSSEFTTRDMLTVTLNALLQCDFICFLDGWEKASGCQIERGIAEKLKMGTLYFHDGKLYCDYDRVKEFKL